MTTKIFTQHAQASHIAAACATALIANYKLFTDALTMAATPPADAVILAGYVEPEGVDWNATIEQLKKAKDHAMRCISALHIAAVENRDEMLLDASQATAQHALACLKSALTLHAPLRAAVTKCSMLGGDTYTHGTGHISPSKSILCVSVRRTRFSSSKPPRARKQPWQRRRQKCLARANTSSR